jgi:hypothetical protein
MTPSAPDAVYSTMAAPAPLPADATPLDRLFPSMYTPAPVVPAAIPRAHLAHVAAWEREVMASPLASVVPDARTFLRAHATPELLAILSESGAGSHPAVVRLVADLAQQFNAVNPEARHQRALRSLYPSARSAR